MRSGQTEGARKLAPRVPAMERPPPTLAALGQQKLKALCAAVGMESSGGTLLRTFDLLSRTWANRTRDCPPPACDITDDGSPFEFSLALDGGAPELRMLIEAQGTPATPASNWAAALQLSADISREHGVSIERLRTIAELFAPDGETGIFSLWHAASIRPGQEPEFKVYLNPAARGSARADSTVEAALARLEQSACMAWLHQHALRRGTKDRIIYFSLDLGSTVHARTKVYIAHHDATADDVERIMATVPTHVAGDALRFCNAMVGHQGPFTRRPLLTCMAFVGVMAEPQTVTLHLPVRCYADNDQIVAERVGQLVTPLEKRLHERAVRCMVDGLLTDRTGMQTYTSFRRTSERQRRLTVYLSPEVYTAREGSASADN